jgi:putative spermidine/putrescine transport system permease protein
LGTVSQWLTGERIAFAYGIGGLFMGYLYFSIPRTLLTVMAGVGKLDVALEEAARTLGASPLQVLSDVILPGLRPALVSAGAVCFATSMGAFGTAFTLATRVNVLPIAIYNEFTNYSNFSVAAALSIVLGLVTWLILAVGRQVTGVEAGAAS